MTVSIEKAKQEAISMVEDSISKKCMFSAATSPEEDEHDYSKGDPETPFTIASLTACEGFEGTDSDSGIVIIERHICERYPQFASI